MDVGELARRAQAGDPDAFAELVRRYSAMVTGYALATTRDHDLADDAAQVAFITAWRNLGSLRHPERFGGWLRGIARYECLHLLRQRRSGIVSLDAAGALVAKDPDPADIATDNDAAAAILAAIATLPDHERIVTVLAYLQGQSQRDVAAFLDLPVATVNNRMRSARAHLRLKGVTPMPATTTHDHSDLIDRIGEVVRAEGSVIDARVHQRPPILGHVTIAGADPGAVVSAQVAQYLDDDLVRCFPVGDAPVHAMTASTGSYVQDTGNRTTLPMELSTLRRVISHMRGTTRPTTIVETGIKAIDLCCPPGPGAVVGIIGDMHVGKMVLANELVHRLTTVDPPISLVVLVEVTTESLAIETLHYRTSGAVEAIYLPVADASPDALGPVLDEFDVVITLTRDLGKQRLYPAIDPLRSTSRLLDPATTGPDHLELLERVRPFLRDDPESRRADQLRRYLTQPFFTAEAYTNRPGLSVALPATIADCRAILDGDWDATAPAALTMIGSLDGLPTPG